MTALQTARDAGATYADVRVDATTEQFLSVWQRNESRPVEYMDDFTYGVRVIAKGQWGFAGGQDPSPDAVAQVARQAVEQAEATAAGGGRSAAVALAPAPVVTGVWETPIEIDPFTVPIGDQQAVLLAAADAALAVKGTSSAGGMLTFVRNVRTFASTEGSFTVQTFWETSAGLSVYAPLRGDPETLVWRQPAGVDTVGAGYEAILDAQLPAGLAAAAAAAVAAGDVHPIDVGRYDVVVSPSVMASLIEGTLTPAVSWDRASGREVAFEGTSFIGSPGDALGSLRLGSRLLRLTADRSLPRGLATVRWDDEGVAPDSFPLISRGVLVDYFTTRESAQALALLRNQQAHPIQSHGCAAGSGLSTPRESTPNLTLEPQQGSTTTVDDLIADVKHGIYLSEDAEGGTDEQLISGRYTASSIQEIRNGKLTGYVRDAAIEFRTVDLWRSLDAIGGVGSLTAHSGSGCTIRAVPGRFRQVNVINTARIV